MSKTDIHLVSWNRPKMTELVIKTIHRNTDRDSFRLVVLDNASEPETVDRLQQLADNGLIDEFIPIKTNLGLEAARNLLLKNCTQNDYFVCVDNDCLPPVRRYGKDWLVRLKDLMGRYEDYAAISLRTQVMIGTGDPFVEADIAGDEILDFPHPGGSYRIMDTKVTYFVGGWDREAPGRGSEETYICGKLREAGFKTAFATKIRSLHLFGTADTDRWGYHKDSEPEEHGHRDISHPALDQGDFKDEVLLYASREDTEVYFGERSNS